MAQACNTQKSTVSTSDKNSMENMNMSNSECPDGGTCIVKIQKNKKLVLKEDEFGVKYVQIEDGSNMVIEYTYSKKGPEGTMDGNYSEIIRFEIPNATSKLSKENTSLSDVNLIYEKQCFCRGDAGAYEVTKGKLSLEKTDKAIMFDLQFKINKTSQVVSHITETIKL